MRPRLIGGLLFLVTIPPFAAAQAPTRSDAEVLAQGDAAFRRGIEHKTQLLQARQDFSDAADAYLELHRRGVRNPALYLNLGNAAVLADRWPEAIWAYHMGLALDPNHADLREHLAFVRGKVLYPAAGQGRLEAESWPIWLHRPTMDELSWMLIFTYTLAWFAGAWAFCARSAGLWLVTAALVALGMVAAIGLGYETRRTEIDRETPVVVIAENAPFYRGNATSYPQHVGVPVLPRGLEARQVHRRGNWLQIRLATGEVGWLPVGQALVVEP